MKEKIKKEFDEIHAPEHLVNKTALLMKQEEAKKQKQKRFFSKRLLVPGSVILVAAFIFLFVRSGYLSPNDRIQIANVSNSSFSLDLNLGAVDRTHEKENLIQSKTSTESAIIPDFLKEIEPSQIGKIEVYIGYDEKKDIYYAGYEQKGTYCFLTGQSISEADFIDYLKKEIK